MGSYRWLCWKQLSAYLLMFYFTNEIVQDVLLPLQGRWIQQMCWLLSRVRLKGPRIVVSVIDYLPFSEILLRLWIVYDDLMASWTCKSCKYIRIIVVMIAVRSIRILWAYAVGCHVSWLWVLVLIFIRIADGWIWQRATAGMVVAFQFTRRRRSCPRSFIVNIAHIILFCLLIRVGNRIALTCKPLRQILVHNRVSYIHAVKLGCMLQILRKCASPVDHLLLSEFLYLMLLNAIANLTIDELHDLLSHALLEYLEIFAFLICFIYQIL